MPDFSIDDLDIDPDDFLDACSVREIKEVIEWLVDNNHISKSTIESVGNNALNVNDIMFQENLDAISKSKLLLSIEEEEVINRIGEKFKYLY
jgi:hypothetical protein